ncbi:unnamed protein product, partial [Aphanomyces euteiches]
TLRPTEATQNTVHERAIEILQDDFTDVIDIDDMVRAFDVMENSTHASMFLSMKGEPREKWLERQINLQRRG